TNCRCITCVEPKRASDWLSLAIGSVPCSGALLILLYGAANNLLWASIAMVTAISVGMAITLSWIGALALMGRNYADRQADNRLGERSYGRLHQWLKFAGACCVLLLGLSLFVVTLTSGG
ncbi:MAG: transporter, partial [Symploca sp. SIO2G7]|nr:transporter [Symploca sp. SIO2G7]